MLPTSRAPFDDPQPSRAIDAIQPKGAPPNKGAEIAVSLDWLSRKGGGLHAVEWRPENTPSVGSSHEPERGSSGRGGRP